MSRTSSDASICGPLPRRRFLTRSGGLLIGFASLPVMAGGRDEVIDTAVDAAVTDSAPSIEDVYHDMANLGAQLKKEQPEVAAKLEETARSELGIGLHQNVDQSTAIQAQQVLTAPERTARELQQDEYVMVMGWLLSYSEAAAVLLHAAVEARQSPGD